jgi:hypothetical protein
MTDINEVERATIETGDKTYVTRKERFDYIMASIKPGPNRKTYRELAKELGVSHQAIGRVAKRGVVRPSGRPRSNEGRIRRLSIRLNNWQTRRTTKLGKGLDVSYEDANIAKLEAQIAALR